MPEISRFLGIVIRMYFLDHDPPHVHANYAGTEARVRIEPVGLLDGRLSPRVLGLVLEWVTLLRTELLDNWRRLRSGEQPMGIEPLE